MTVTEIISEIISGGGITVLVVLSLIQISPLKINPWSAIAKAIGRALNVELSNKIDENEAKNARYRIIRFDDEIRHNKMHTEEHFSQIMDDITDYERYCREHPDYKNSKAVSAIAKIKSTYEKCKDQNLFL